MRKQLWCRLCLGISLLVFGWLSSGLTAQAATTPPQPQTSPPTSIMGINLAGGFTQQPLDSHQVAGKSVTLAVQGTRNILEAAAYPFGSRKYVWWESTDGGTTYSKVGTNSTTYTFTAPNVTSPTTLNFQVEYDFTGLGLFINDWSRIASITVAPDRIPATDIHVTADKDTLNNSETTVAHATLTPDDATDQVTWTSSDANLASVDAYGDVTATAAASNMDGTADDHGVVTITGETNGHSDSVKLTVGALQNVTVTEGTAATFTLKDIPSSMTVNNWYRVQDGQSTALNQTGITYTISRPTAANDDGTSYYAVLNYSVNGTTKTVSTNAARLTVEKSGDLALTAVPNFNFGSVSLVALSHGVTLENLDSHSDGSAHDGNTNGELTVTDNRTVGGDWTLSASLAPFATSSDTSGRLNTTELTLFDPFNRLAQLVPADNLATTVYTSRDYLGQNFDVSDSTLNLAPSPLASAGEYQSVVTWTLVVAPTGS